MFITLVMYTIFVMSIMFTMLIMVCYYNGNGNLDTEFSLASKCECAYQHVSFPLSNFRHTSQRTLALSQ